MSDPEKIRLLQDISGIVQEFGEWLDAKKASGTPFSEGELERVTKFMAMLKGFLKTVTDDMASGPH